MWAKLSDSALKHANNYTKYAESERVSCLTLVNTKPYELSLRYDSDIFVDTG